jgi:hypothetical protein
VQMALRTGLTGAGNISFAPFVSLFARCSRWRGLAYCCCGEGAGRLRCRGSAVAAAMSGF